MRHRKRGRKLSRTTDHRMALYRNQVTDLLQYGKIVTTEAKAKEICSMAEKMVGLGKAGDLSSRRQALGFINSKKVVKKVFNELATRYADRNGGYTRIAKLGPRLGDGAPMAQLELV